MEHLLHRHPVQWLGSLRSGAAVGTQLPVRPQVGFRNGLAAVRYAQTNSSDGATKHPKQPRRPGSHRLRNSAAYQKLRKQTGWRDRPSGNERGANSDTPDELVSAQQPSPPPLQPSQLESRPSSAAQAAPELQQPPPRGPGQAPQQQQLDEHSKSVFGRFADQQAQLRKTYQARAEQQQPPQQHGEQQQQQQQQSPNQGYRQPSLAKPELVSSRFAPAVSRPAPSQAPSAGHASAPKRLTTVRFWLTFHAEYGQRLRVVGSHEHLGAWQLIDGPELHWSDGDRWHVDVQLPAGSVYEYKYVLLEGNGTHAIAWQRGNNSVLALKHDEAEVEVYDNWGGQPGAAVVAGGHASTRENRLLTWANEIEALVASQRGELRRSRMELAAAQEEARESREEARRLRAELALVETERKRSALKMQQLETSNRLLRTQLAETTVSFRHAMEKAHEFLLQAEGTVRASYEEADSHSDDKYNSGEAQSLDHEGGEPDVQPATRASASSPPAPRKAAERPAPSARPARTSARASQAPRSQTPAPNGSAPRPSSAASSAHSQAASPDGPTPGQPLASASSGSSESRADESLNGAGASPGSSSEGVNASEYGRPRGAAPPNSSLASLAHSPDHKGPDKTATLPTSGLELLERNSESKQASQVGSSASQSTSRPQGQAQQPQQQGGRSRAGTAPRSAASEQGDNEPAGLELLREEPTPKTAPGRGATSKKTKAAAAAIHESNLSQASHAL